MIYLREILHDAENSDFQLTKREISEFWDTVLGYSVANGAFGFFSAAFVILICRGLWIRTAYIAGQWSKWPTFFRDRLQLIYCVVQPFGRSPSSRRAKSVPKVQPYFTNFQLKSEFWEFVTKWQMRCSIVYFAACFKKFGLLFSARLQSRCAMNIIPLPPSASIILTLGLLNTQLGSQPHICELICCNTLLKWLYTDLEFFLLIIIGRVEKSSHAGVKRSWEILEMFKMTCLQLRSKHCKPWYLKWGNWEPAQQQMQLSKISADFRIKHQKLYCLFWSRFSLLFFYSLFTKAQK